MNINKNTDHESNCNQGSTKVLLSGKYLVKIGIINCIIGTIVAIIILLKIKYDYFSDNTKFMTNFYFKPVFVALTLYAGCLLLRFLYGSAGYGDLQKLKNLNIVEGQLYTLKGLMTFVYIVLILICGGIAGYFCALVFMMTTINKYR